MTREINSIQFDSAVFAYYMEHGKPCTAKELAEYAGMSISSVRKIVTSNKYSSACTTVSRPVREKSYGTIRCFRNVDAYEPRLSLMREELMRIKTRQQLRLKV